MDAIPSTFDSVLIAFSLLAKYWWVYLPPLLFVGTVLAWQNYTRTAYLKSIKWVMLELTPPPDVQKSPKIAENLFSGIHGIYAKSLDWKKMFFGGKVPDWMSCEIVGQGGEMYFYMRIPESIRNVVESHIFAQYPDAEVAQVEDYVAQMPVVIPNDEYDIFGAELVFTREDAYPLITHPFFEEDSGKDEFKRSDPLSPLAEIMSTLLPGEHLLLQLLARPTGDQWVKDAQPIIDKMVGKEPAGSKASGLDSALGTIAGLLDSLLPGGGSAAPEKKDKVEFNLQKLTPGQKFVLEQIENKIAKLGFKAGYRFIYLAKKEVFNRARITSVIGMFKQMYSNNLNSFKPNGDTVTVGKGILAWMFPSDKGFGADKEEYDKKVEIYNNYRDRAFVKKHVILNIEELATLFHLPGLNIKAPAFPRVEAKKGQPPVNLPTR